MTPSPDFEVLTHRADHALVVAPIGDIDMATAPALARALEAHGTGGLVLDLRAVEFMDSQGIGLIIELQRRAEREGFVFEVVRGSADVQRLLDMTGLVTRLRLIDEPERSAARGVREA
jgi:anti-sigma B factor antagonist